MVMAWGSTPNSGRNAVFGYVVEGMDVLEELGVDDRSVSARVIEGADNLQPHA